MPEALRAIEMRPIVMPRTEIGARSVAGGLPLTPYPGLRPFEQDEWPIFFGRERITRDIVDRLTATQIVVIHGGSGCGKSSFVRAGVLAQLDRECAREGWQWQTAAMRPGGSPLWNLAEAIARIKHAGSAGPSIEQIRTVRQQLNIGRGALRRIAQDLKLGSERQVCILLDQFEELFRFVEEIGPDEAEMLAAIICGFADAPPDGIHLVITVRSDHLGDFAQFHGFAEVVNGNQYLLPRLSDDDLIRAITQPAILYKGEVKLDLAMNMLRESDGEVDALPLIQHCLMRMWQEVESGQKIIELQHYHGLREGLSAHADEIVARIMADPTLSPRKASLQHTIETSVSCADGHRRERKAHPPAADLRPTRRCYSPGSNFAEYAASAVPREGCRVRDATRHPRSPDGRHRRHQPRGFDPALDQNGWLSVPTWLDPD